MIEVWGRRSSSNVQKVMWTIGELGLPFERHSVGGGFGGNKSPDYLAMNPNGLVPVIRDGDIVMFESNAIVRYLAARHGNGGLRPVNPAALAAAEQWLEWQQTTVYPLISAIFWNNVRLPAAERDAKAVAAAENRLFDVLPIADRHLAGQAYFAGDTLSMADIVLGVMFWRYRQLECRRPELPHVMRWFAALQARDAYRQWVMVPVGRDVEEWKVNERALA